MRAIIVPLLFWLGLVLCVSCTEEKDPQADLLPFDEELDLPLSFIEAPVVFQVAQIEEKINQAITGTLYEDQSFEDQNEGLKIRIRKVGRIELQTKHDYLYFSIPLSVWASKRLIKSRLFSRPFEPTKEVDFSLKIQFRSKINFDKNWKFNTQTKYVDIEWQKKPKVELLGVVFDLSGILESQLLQKRAELEQKIDLATAKLNVIEKQVRKIWSQMQRPILIEKKITKYMWLVAQPEHISIGNIKARNQEIAVAIRLESYLHSQIGDTPQVILKPLPLLKPNVNKIHDDFELHVKGEVPYSLINDLLAKKVNDTIIQIPKTDYRLQIKEASVHGNGKNLVLTVDIKGDFEGKLRMKGIPRFDSLAKTLHFDEFDYELESEEYLLTTANWLLKRSAKDELQKLLVLPLETYVQQLPELIQKGLSKGKLGKTALFELKDFELYPRFIQVDKDHLRLYVKATGNVGVEIMKL